mmetsp:Transcript_4920/g.16407  ORF Transcript_4920/g.16407 Transcript_4920/m.16407 type:complete len:338 (-) Transcript_4920:851-1864(-)
MLGTTGRCVRVTGGSCIALVSTCACDPTAAACLHKKERWVATRAGEARPGPRALRKPRGRRRADPGCKVPWFVGRHFDAVPWAGGGPHGPAAWEGQAQSHPAPVLCLLPFLLLLLLLVGAPREHEVDVERLLEDRDHPRQVCQVRRAKAVPAGPDGDHVEAAHAHPQGREATRVQGQGPRGQEGEVVDALERRQEVVLRGLVVPVPGALRRRVLGLRLRVRGLVAGAGEGGRRGPVPGHGVGRAPGDVPLHPLHPRLHELLAPPGRAPLARDVCELLADPIFPHRLAALFGREERVGLRGPRERGVEHEARRGARAGEALGLEAPGDGEGRHPGAPP